MSLSQKHTGKVLVPWFNSQEWQNVAEFLTSDCQENWRKALAILKIWKMRNPLLSAGIEGTLILLEAILTDVSLVSEYHIIQVYSITLMRFLNICAANSTKQGTFNRTVSKNDLPKWLIDLRHEIAHDHKLPSKSMLEMGLDFSLRWLITRYWSVESTIIDYIVDNEAVDSKVLDSLNVFVRLNLSLYTGVDLNEYDNALMEKINYLACKRYNSTETDKYGLLLVIEEILKQALSNPENKKLVNEVAAILVHEKALLATRLEITEQETEIIPTNFKKMWSSLLEILYENEGFLSGLLSQLWMFIIKDTNEYTKKIALAWIFDIVNELLKMQHLQEELNTYCKLNPAQADLKTIRFNLQCKLEKNFPEYRNSLGFENVCKVMLVNLHGFQEDILNFPNIYSAKIVDRVMKFNKVPEEQRILITNIIKKMYGEVPVKVENIVSETFTINDLPTDIDNLMTNGFSDIKQSPSETDVEMSDETQKTDNRWTFLKDFLLYKNCPLGRSPHQSFSSNPSFDSNIFNLNLRLNL